MTAPSHIAIRALAPYAAGNSNTGNVYEIAFALTAIRQMGRLPNAVLDALAPYFATIRTHNPKFTEAVVAHIRALPAGTGLSLDGQPVTDIRSVTQDDGDGGTGDFVFVLTDGTERSISVEEGAPAAATGAIHKCLSNPTCKRLGCTPAMIDSFKAIAATAVEEFKAEMTVRFSADPATWPARTKSEAQRKAVAAVAAATVANYNALPQTTQAALLSDLLRVSDSPRPADYLALVKKGTWTISLWKWGDLRINPADYRLRVEGDYAVFVHRDIGTPIGKTQIKFNNGVYKRQADGTWQSSSLTSSWNGGFCITDCFTMTPAPLA
jgi:hypothetical protein